MHSGVLTAHEASATLTDAHQAPAHRGVQAVNVTGGQPVCVVWCGVMWQHQLQGTVWGADGHRKNMFCVIEAGAR